MAGSRTAIAALLSICATAACSSSGDSSPPQPEIPAAPSNVGATGTLITQILVHWTDNSTNESGFRIERSLSASTGFVEVGTLGPDFDTYGDNGLSPSTTYYYRVRAFNDAGNSAYSNVASATTLTPMSAESVGRLCTQLADCPLGGECATVVGVGSQTAGFCTIPCAGVDDTTTCSNGFAGPGASTCLLHARSGWMECVILCDVPNGSGECPTGLTCTFAPSDDLNVCVQP